MCISTRPPTKWLEEGFCYRRGNAGSEKTSRWPVNDSIVYHRNMIVLFQSWGWNHPLWTSTLSFPPFTGALYKKISIFRRWVDDGYILLRFVLWRMSADSARQHCLLTMKFTSGSSVSSNVLVIQHVDSQRFSCEFWGTWRGNEILTVLFAFCFI